MIYVRVELLYEWRVLEEPEHIAAGFWPLKPKKWKSRDEQNG